MDTNDVVNEEEVWDILTRTNNPSEGQVADVLATARAKEGLSLTDVGVLLNTHNPNLIDRMFEVSGNIKQEIYGERLVLFAPLYLSSFCVNDCDYCGFHARNPEPRKKLTLEEVAEQVKHLIDMGHKRLLLEFGEHPRLSPIDYVIDVINTVYATTSQSGEIRRVNVNLAATTVEDYKKLKKAGIGTYQLFQETYHQATYSRVHHGPKTHYERQLFAHDRAIAAGLDDVGLGVLYGLFDHRFDTLSLVAHAQYLDRKFRIGPHTISVPRIQPAPTAEIDPRYTVSDVEFLKVISILRMAVPYTGMIISTRESAEMRAKAFEIGISQASAASRTSPGGYGRPQELQQFATQDHRPLDEVVRSILNQGLVPSFCTACYRTGRTGERIMSLLKSGEIHTLCRPNALLTFKEYLEDYASVNARTEGNAVIEAYLLAMPSPLQKETRTRLGRIEDGERDLYF